MEKEFDAEDFVTRLNRGEFDRNLFEEVRKLSALQLEKVAKVLMAGLSIQTEGRGVLPQRRYERGSIQAGEPKNNQSVH